jgi:hypothetical protein
MRTHMARERALQMARFDWENGKITREDIITQARLYESYLIGKPVLVSTASEQSTRTPLPS